MIVITLASMLSCSSSALSSQNVANSVNSCRVGGVVISKNRVNNVRNEQAGSFSCGSQLFVTPVSAKKDMKFICFISMHFMLPKYDKNNEKLKKPR